MEKAARKYNRIVQVGQWQRSDPHWDEAANYLKAGNIGRIRTVKVWAYQDGKPTLPVVADSPVPAGVDYDMWLGPAPKRPFNPYRFHYNFRFFWDYAGGLMSDWGVHLLIMRSRHGSRSAQPRILRRRQVRLSGRRYGDARYFNGNLCLR